MKGKYLEWLREYYWLILLSIFLMLVCFSGTALLWDENVYLANARSHTTGSNFSEDFRFPLISWLISGVWLLTGENVLIIKIIMSLMAIGTVLITNHLLKEHVSKKDALLWTLLYILTPIFLYWAFRIYTDILSLFYIMVAVLFMYIHKKKDNAIYIILAAVSSGMAFLSRFTTGIFIAIIILYLAYKRKFSLAAIYTIIIFLTLAPWAYQMYADHKDPLWNVKEQYAISASSTPFDPDANQLINILNSINIGVIIFFILGAYQILKKMRKISSEILILSIYTACSLIFLVFFTHLQDKRYILSVLPMIIIIIIIGTIGFEGFKTQLRKQNRHKIKNPDKIIRIIRISMIIIALVMIISSIKVFYDNEYRCGMDSALIRSVKYFDSLLTISDREISEGEEFILGGAWPYYGYGLNVKANSLWSQNISMLIDVYHPRYIIYDGQHGLPYNQSLMSEILYKMQIDKVISGRCGEKIYIYKTIYAK